MLSFSWSSQSFSGGFLLSLGSGRGKNSSGQRYDSPYYQISDSLFYIEERQVAVEEEVEESQVSVEDSALSIAFIHLSSYLLLETLNSLLSLHELDGHQ